MVVIEFKHLAHKCDACGTQTTPVLTHGALPLPSFWQRREVRTQGGYTIESTLCPWCVERMDEGERLDVKLPIMRNPW